jgi:SAM-dependent methyltransferase
LFLLAQIGLQNTTENSYEAPNTLEIETGKMVIPHTKAITGTRVEALREVFWAKHRFCAPLIDRAIEAFGINWVKDFDLLLKSLFDSKAKLEYAASGYSSFAINSMRYQKAFERDLVYPKQTYAEAAEKVYHNHEYMMKEYLPGLLLSHFLWPHHYRQLLFFHNAFILPMSLAEKPTFVEVGIGTTIYSRRVLNAIPSAFGRGYDISRSSCEFAIEHIKSIGSTGRYSVYKKDVLLEAVSAAPWLICVEVLEHLEDPVDFLRGLYQMLEPGGRGFISAAINSGHADHIYLYRGVEEVQEHLIEAGFLIEQGFMARAFAPPKEGVPVPEAAAFIAKRPG